MTDSSRGSTCTIMMPFGVVDRVDRRMIFPGEGGSLERKRIIFRGGGGVVQRHVGQTYRKHVVLRCGCSVPAAE